MFIARRIAYTLVIDDRDRIPSCLSMNECIVDVSPTTSLHWWWLWHRTITKRSTTGNGLVKDWCGVPAMWRWCLPLW